MSLICLCSVFWPSILFFPSLFCKSSPASGQIGLPAPPACPPPRCSLAHCRLDSSTSHKWYQSRGVSGPAWTSIRVSQSRRWARKRRRVNVPNRCWRRGFVQMLTSAEVMRFVQQDKKKKNLLCERNTVCLRQGPLLRLKVMNVAVELPSFSPQYVASIWHFAPDKLFHAGNTVF